jgi:L-fuconolactonase
MTGDAKGEYCGLAYRNDAELKGWLAKRPSEAALEPALPIIDPHHHFWDTPQRGRYLLPELLADLGGGHNIVATVFLECRSMYRKDGPTEMAPVGEVEFVNGIAAMSASGGYGPCRVAEAIIGHADLTLGARVREVLEAEIRVGGGRFRGIRHGVSWDGNDAIQRYATRIVPPHLVRDPKFREGFAQLAPLGLSFESGNTTRNCRTRSTSPAPFPTPRSSSTMSAACSASALIPAAGRRSLPAGRRTSANWPSVRTSTSSSAVSA